MYLDDFILLKYVYALKSYLRFQIKKFNMIHKFFTSRFNMLYIKIIYFLKEFTMLFTSLESTISCKLGNDSYFSYRAHADR